MTKYLTTNEVQDRYKVSRSSLYRWQDNPEIRFPAPMKIGARILWRESDLDDFDSYLMAEAE